MAGFKKMPVRVNKYIVTKNCYLMSAVKAFSEFGISKTIDAFVGNSIGIKRVLNKRIVVCKFKIGPSKYSGERLDLQIEFDGEKRVLWTGSKGLIEQIKLVPANGFPFSTTIIETESEHFQFT
jgi:hypothetical protein